MYKRFRKRAKKEEGKWKAVRGDLLKRIGIEKEEIKCERERERKS